MIKNEKGQSLVETALSIPLLLLLIVGIIDIGRLTITYSALHFTVQETVRIGGLGGTDLEMVAFAKNNFTLGDADLLVMKTPIPNEATRKSGDYLTIILEYPFDPVTPLIDNILPTTIQVDSTIRIE